LLFELTERLVSSATPLRVLALAVLLLVATFCWCWRERCRRKTVKEIEQQRHEKRMELLQQYGKLLSDGKLTAGDLPWIARLERIDLPVEIEPPVASSPVRSGVVPFETPNPPQPS
jgi:hypothetical protein